MYKKMAAHMKKQVESGKVPDEAKESVLRSAEVYEFIGEADERGLLPDVVDNLLDVVDNLLGEGLFNDAIKGYVSMALNDVELTQSTKDAIESSLRYYLDTKTFSEAREYYRRH